MDFSKTSTLTFTVACPTYKFMYLVHRFVEEESQAKANLHGSGEATAHPPSTTNLDIALETVPPSRVFFEEDWQTR